MQIRTKSLAPKRVFPTSVHPSKSEKTKQSGMGPLWRSNPDIWSDSFPCLVAWKFVTSLGQIRTIPNFIKVIRKSKLSGNLIQKRSVWPSAHQIPADLSAAPGKDRNTAHLDLIRTYYNLEVVCNYWIFKVLDLIEIGNKNRMEFGFDRCINRLGCV